MTPENTGEEYLGSLPPSFPSHPQKTLDLHGYTIAEAEYMVHSFLADARSEGCLFVQIITGHGENTLRGYSVLYNEVEKILDDFKKAYHFQISPQKGHFDIVLR